VTNPNGHFSGDCISAIYAVLPSQIFTRVTDWPRLPSSSPTGKGVPPKKINRENLKFGLKLSVWASITSGLVRKSSPKFSRRRRELWSTNERGMGTNIDTPKVLVHCKVTQFRMPRGYMVQFSFGRWRCWERNFVYLNWQSTRNCGARRSHVWLCHAHLVILCYVAPFNSGSSLTSKRMTMNDLEWSFCYNFQRARRQMIGSPPNLHTMAPGKQASRVFSRSRSAFHPLGTVALADWNVHSFLAAYWNKKLSYCWETVRRESMPRIAEMDVKMTT